MRRPASRSGRIGRLPLSFAVVALCSIGMHAHATLVHRWSFSETSGTSLLDSVGGSNGVIVGTGTHTLGGGQITLAGGSGANYVDLGSGLLTGFTSATIEIWATEHSIESWGRIFDMGSSLNVSGSSSDSYFQWAWNQGTSSATTQVGWMTNGVRNDHNYTEPFSLGREYDIAVTIADGAGAGNTTLVDLYINGALFESFDNPSPLTTFADNVFTLGKSLWPGDSVAHASYDEVRIYNTALQPTQIREDYTLGPNVASVPEPISVAVLGVGFAGLGAVRRRRAN